MQHVTENRKIVTKACDACRRRKIRCKFTPGGTPCQGCTSAKLSCTWDLPRGQGGNRGVRATVLNELRAKQQRVIATAPFSPGHESRSISSATSSPAVSSPDANPTTMEAFVDAYAAHIHPVIPLVAPEFIRDEIGQALSSSLSNSFILAFCAYVAHFGRLAEAYEHLRSRSLNASSGRQFLNAALATLKSESSVDANHYLVYLSFFAYGAYAGHGDYQHAWFYLRQATTLFMMLKNDDIGWFDAQTRRRLFWVLLISERAHAVRRNRPITLQLTPLTPGLDENQERGLSYLAAVFRPLDEIFFSVWNGSPQECSKEWLLRLENDVRYAISSAIEVSNDEIANIRVSQFWLQIKLWELFPRYGFLSTESVYECLTFRYPIVVARSLTVLAMKVPVGSFQVHGVGMTEKVFDIACALTDVMPFVSLPNSQLELGPADYLIQTASLIAKLPGGSSKFVPLLLAKVNELLPDLVKVICDAMQLPPNVLNDPMSPDTRFVYEEEVGRGLYTDLRRGR